MATKKILKGHYLVSFFIFLAFLGYLPVTQKCLATTELRPNFHNDLVGATTNPHLAYDGDAGTAADIMTATDASPSITFSWPAGGSYSSLVLMVKRSAENHKDDTWGIRYSVNSGNTWPRLEGMWSENKSPEFVSFPLDPSLDLSQLRIRIDTNKYKKPDAGYLKIFDIKVVGEILEPPALEQSAYRFFENVDSVDLSAIVSDVGGADEATGITIQNDLMYVVGFEPGGWRIEKRDLDGRFLCSTTSDSLGTPNDVATDGAYLYIVGDDYLDGNYRWRIEKRSLSDLSLDVDFGDDGVLFSNPSDENDSANALAIFSGNLMELIYVVGSDRSHGASDAQWRIEVIDPDNGSLVDYMVHNPSVDDDVPYTIAIDDTNIYVAGYDRIPGSSKKPGKGNKGSSNARWRIEKRDLFNLTLTEPVGNHDYGDGFDTVTDIALHSTGLYVVGSIEEGFFDTAWRIERRRLDDLTIINEVTENFGYDDRPRAIAISSTVEYAGAYIAGFSSNVDPGEPADTAWHIEKRDLSDGPNNLVSIDPYPMIHDISHENNDRAYAIAIDDSFMYVAGYQNPGLAEWRIEKRALGDGSLNWLAPLAPENVPVTLNNGEIFRLRMLVHVSSGTLLVGSQQFKLQFEHCTVDQFGHCTVDCAWADVTNGSAIAFHDNPTPVNGDALLKNTEDPSHDDSHDTKGQTYVEKTYIVETNSFTNAVSTVSSDEDAMWDFSLEVKNGAPSGCYRLRIVKDDGDDTPLNTYLVYPILTVN
jgi:hypothetical protein